MPRSLHAESLVINTHDVVNPNKTVPGHIHISLHVNKHALVVCTCFGHSQSELSSCSSTLSRLRRIEKIAVSFETSSSRGLSIAMTTLSCFRADGMTTMPPPPSPWQFSDVVSHQRGSCSKASSVFKSLFVTSVPLGGGGRILRRVLVIGIALPPFEFPLTSASLDSDSESSGGEFLIASAGAAISDLFSGKSVGEPFTVGCIALVVAMQLVSPLGRSRQRSQRRQQQQQL